MFLLMKHTEYPRKSNEMFAMDVLLVAYMFAHGVTLINLREPNFHSHPRLGPCLIDRTWSIVDINNIYLSIYLPTYLSIYLY